MHWQNDFPSWIQAIASIVSLIVAVILGIITWRTLRANNRMATSAERQIQQSADQILLMREQLALEYKPNVVISVNPDKRQLMLLQLFNLGKYVVHPVQIELRKLDDASFPVHRGQVRRYPNERGAGFEYVQALLPGEGAFLGFVREEITEYVLGAAGLYSLTVDFMYGSTSQRIHQLSNVRLEISAERWIKIVERGVLRDDT